jgi:hypothetical protein
MHAPWPALKRAHDLCTFAVESARLARDLLESIEATPFAFELPSSLQPRAQWEQFANSRVVTGQPKESCPVEQLRVRVRQCKVQQWATA